MHMCMYMNKRCFFYFSVSYRYPDMRLADGGQGIFLDQLMRRINILICLDYEMNTCFERRIKTLSPVKKFFFAQSNVLI